MPVLTKKEFAARVGMATKNLTAYIQRGQIVVNPDGYLDDRKPVNKAFLEKHAGKAAAAAGSSKATAKAESLVAESTGSSNTLVIHGFETLPVDQSQRLQRHLDVKKTEQETELLMLKKAKLKGEVIPSALMKPVVMQHNQSFVAAFKNGGEELIRKMAKRKDLTGAEVAELRGELVDIINQALQSATSNTIKALKHIISEHSQTRGVGERV